MNNEFRSIVLNQVVVLKKSFNDLIEALDCVIENGKIKFYPRDVMIKSMRKDMKARVAFILGLCESGFYYNGYVVIRTFDGLSTEVSFVPNKEHLKMFYNEWEKNEVRNDFIVLDCKREGHGSDWDVNIECFQKLD